MVPMDITPPAQYSDCICSTSCACSEHYNTYSTGEETIYYNVRCHSAIEEKIWKWINLDTSFARCSVKRKIVPVKNVKPLIPYIRRSMNSISGMKGIALQKKLDRR